MYISDEKIKNTLQREEQHWREEIAKLEHWIIDAKTNLEKTQRLLECLEKDYKEY